jgi:hypothetical protein
MESGIQPKRRQTCVCVCVCVPRTDSLMLIWRKSDLGLFSLARREYCNMDAFDAAGISRCDHIVPPRHSVVPPTVHSNCNTSDKSLLICLVCLVVPHSRLVRTAKCIVPAWAHQTAKKREDSPPSSATTDLPHVL